MDTFKTIKHISEGLYKDKGSKFIAIAFPSETEDEIKNHLAEVKREYHDARHHCYAYSIGKNRELYRVNDDGEPSGTAGKPIFGQIQSFELTNILIVVIRYFGGTKLGVRGLIDAYRAASKQAILNNTIIEKFVTYTYKIEFKYSEMNNVMKILKDMDLPQQNHCFEEACYLEFKVRESLADEVVQAFSSIDNVKITLL